MCWTHTILHASPFLLRTLLLLGLMLQAGISQAQVKTDITGSGLGTNVNNKNGTVYEITGGSRPGNGPNLFHSFGRFSVGTGDTARFINTTPTITTRNILSRVTGGQRSNIFGTIDTLSYLGANLFLINPAGVVFGPGAKLDVSGSFHVSTANYLKFADGAKFFANTSQEGLTVAEPAAFGFLGPTAARISIDRSQLRVPNGQTLSVVGGEAPFAGETEANLKITGANLAAPGGRIHIASVASTGEATLSPDLNVGSFARLGKIDISANSLIGASNFQGNGGGTVLIRGGRLVVDRSSILANSLPGDAAGNRFIDIAVRGDVVLGNGTSILATTRTGPGGNISLNVGTLSLTGGSLIGSQTSAGGGRAGNVTVAATDSVSISGRGSGGNASALFSETLSTGNAGRVSISAPSLNMTNGGTIITATRAATPGPGRGGDIVMEVGSLSVTAGAGITSESIIGEGGNITVRARDSVTISGRDSRGQSGIFSRTGFSGSGRAGDILVDVGKFSLTGGALVQSGSITSPQGGNVTIRAKDSIVISGRDNSGNSSGISNQAVSRPAGPMVISARSLIMDNAFIRANTRGAGAGGNIEVNVNNLILTGASRINVSSDLASATGNAGNLTINADSVNISRGSSLLSNTVGRGHGGNIDVRAGQVQLHNGTVSASSSGTADATAGKITINAREAFQSDKGSVTTSARQAHGGDIAITAGQVHLSNGTVISATSSGTKDAGNITINAGTFRSRNSQVTTEANQAVGGNILLNAGRMVHLADSKITTSVRGGVGRGGDITIDPQFVVLNHSQIRADAFGGPGGNIRIAADVYLTQDSVLSASSALGVPGTINIQASITDVSGSLARLPEAVLHGAELLRASCAARLAGGKASSLVVGGRDGLPLEPGGLLPSPLYLEGQASAPSAGSSVTWQTLPTSRFTLLGSEGLRIGTQKGFSKVSFNLGCGPTRP